MYGRIFRSRTVHGVILFAAVVSAGFLVSQLNKMPDGCSLACERTMTLPPWGGRSDSRIRPATVSSGSGQVWGERSISC